MSAAGPRVGWLGTGLMGMPMARRLAAAGFQVSAYNRTAAKAQALQVHGVRSETTPAQAMATADFVVTMLSDAEVTRAVLFDGARGSTLRGRIVLQMGTIGVDESRALSAAVQACQGAYLEAPVLGSTPQAEAGQLIIMAGGPAAVFERCRPVLNALGPEPVLLGPVGSAAAAKLAFNQMIAGLTASFAASLAFVSAHGIDIETFMRLLRESALYAPTFDKKLPRMRTANYAEPNFPTAHLLKDLLLFTETARKLAIDVSSSEAIAALLARTLETVAQPSDYAALFSAIARRPAAKP